MNRRLIRGGDLFCGAGGTSTGLIKAVKQLGYDYDLLAINHWDIAIATHQLNHEKVKHLCQNLDKVDPLELVPGGRLDILVASPECTHHSNARGGKPRSDQKRADAWLLMRWIEKLYIKNLLIENVKEFMNWGPLGANGQPLKRKRGEYFRLLINALEVNYNVEYDVLNCANYGDPTTRERFFLMARRKGHAMFSWPTQSHASPADLLKRKQQPTLFASNGVRLRPWRTARNHVIDWEIESRSIFDRKRPLSPNTMARIFAGLRKHSGLSLVMATGGRQTNSDPRSVEQPLATVMPNSRLNVVQPFTMKLSHTKSKSPHTRDIDLPLSTITGLQEHAVVEAAVNEACIINMKGQSKSRSVDLPTVTQTAKPHQYLLESQVSEVLINQKGKDGRSRSVDNPTFTQCAQGNHQGLAEAQITPILVNAGGPEGQGRNARSIDEPCKTVMTDDRQGLAEASVIIHSGGPDVDARSVDEPTRTLLTREHQALVQMEAKPLTPFIITNNHGADKHSKNGGHARRAHSVDKPLPAVTSIDAWSVIEPYLIQFFGERRGQDGRTRSVDDPAWTVTGQGRMALVEPEIVAVEGDGKGDSFLLKSYTGSDSASLNKPAPTVTAFEHLGLVENEIVPGDPSILKFYGTAKNGQSVNEPLDTVTAKDRFGLIEPTVVKIKGANGAKDVVGLYIPELGIVVDIRFRMLQPPELARAMSFPKSYKFAGNRENKVMQIGNAVPCRTAQALCKSLLTEPARAKRKPAARKLKKAA
jgi:DNA (cytosine-5)-methyltransferase 1